MINGKNNGVALSPVSAIETYTRMTRVKSNRSASTDKSNLFSLPKYFTDTHWKLKTYNKEGRVQTWIYLKDTGGQVHEILAGERYRLDAGDSAVMPGACFSAVC